MNHGKNSKMITRLEYEYALKVIEQYNYENNIYVSVGDRYKYEKSHARYRKPNLTVGKIYKVEKVKENYRRSKIALAIRDDGNILRWYSYNAIKKRWKKEIEKL